MLMPSIPNFIIVEYRIFTSNEFAGQILNRYVNIHTGTENLVMEKQTWVLVFRWVI